MTRKSLQFLLLTSTVLAGPALAQDSETFVLDEIRIESDDAQNLLGNTRITAQEIEARNAASMKDVFTAESAINSSGGAAIAQKVYVNGIEESLLSVTIDGARQNKSAFHHTGNVLMDPALLKSVEVSSGLAPADAGSGAMAGSIAYETKDARDLLEAGDDFGGILTLGTGTNGYGTRGSLSLFGAQGGVEYLLSGSRVSGSDYKSGDGTTVPGSEPELSSYMAKLAFTSQTGKRLELSASKTEDTGRRAAQFHPFYGVYFARPDFLGTDRNGDSLPDAYELLSGLSRRTSYNLIYTDEAAQGWFDPTVQLSYNEQKTDVIGLWGVNKSLSGVVKNDFQLGNGVLSAGIDFFDETAEGYSRSAVNLGYLGEETHRGIGLFAQARQDLSERVSVSYGARYDAQEFTGADGSEFSDQGISANAAIDVALSNNLTLNAGYASSWGGYELGEAALINLSAPWTYAGLTASKARSARIGLRYQQGAWDVSGALFRTDADDLSAVLPAFPANNRAETTDIRTQGFDGSVGYNWGNGFARLNYTYADVTENGAPISGTRYYYGRPMGHIIGLETGWLATDTLMVGGTAQIALKNSDVGGTAQDAYEVVNLFAEYVPPSLQSVKIRLDVLNLFDENYVARGADYDPSSSVPLPEPGRTVALQVCNQHIPDKGFFDVQRHRPLRDPPCQQVPATTVQAFRAQGSGQL